MTNKFIIGDARFFIDIDAKEVSEAVFDEILINTLSSILYPEALKNIEEKLKEGGVLSLGENEPFGISKQVDICIVDSVKKIKDGLISSPISKQTLGNIYFQIK